MEFTVAKFLEIERANSLNLLTFDGLSYWCYSRDSIYSLLSMDAPLRDVKTKKRGLVKTLKGVIVSFLGNFSRHITRSDILVITRPRYFFRGASYYNYLTDFISDGFRDVIKLEPWSGMNRKEYPPVYTDPIAFFCIVWVNFNVIVKSRRYRRYINGISSYIIQMIYIFVENIEHDSIVVDKAVEIIVKNMLHVFIRKRIYAKLIKRVSPKVVVEICGYSLDSFAINEICKEKGITTVELQHGIKLDRSLEWNYGEDIKIKPLPDYFLAYSDVEAEKIKMPCSTTVIAVGSPYFDFCVENYTKTRTSRTILFCNAITIGDQLSKLALLLAEDNNNDYHIVYKLHPIEYDDWEKKYPWLVHSSIEVLDNESISLYDLFSQAELVVSGPTSAVYEAASFGCKTLIYNSDSERGSSELHQYGMARDFYTYEQLLHYVRHMECLRMDYDTRVFFKPDARNNICELIGRLLNQQVE